ncbi:MAG: branched-chain amino acid ABC transporter permease [Nitrospirae bacterium]|nr:branched-chain amino acid ABC transporter permease [Nitrospirota bacterium]
MDLILQQLINLLSLGSLYALVAIGYTLVYGVLRLINFAHGDVLMLGAYLALFLLTGMHLSPVPLPWPLAFAGAVALTALAGVALERVAYRPLRSAPRLSLLITAIGASLFLENFGIVAFGGRPLAFPDVGNLDRVVQLGALSVPILSLWIPGVTALTLGVTFWIVYRSKVGMAMRAISRDRETAQLMGVDTNRVISLTFGLGSALAAVGGIMWSLKFAQVNPLMGVLPGIKAFVAAVLGGIGSVAGAALGGFLLGGLEVLFVAFLPDWSGYRDALAFFILIAILLLRPTGIMGEELPE